MGRDVSKHGDEALARAVLRAALGARVEQHDDGTRSSMFDLLITYPDGRRAAAEVVSTRNPRSLGLAAAIHKHGYMTRLELTRTWIVWVTPQARIKDLARVAPAHLAQLERDGIDRLPRDWHPAWPAELRSLGAASCRSFPPTPGRPPGFYLIQYPTGVWSPSADVVAREADEFLAVTHDVSAKLVASGRPERHAVVVVTVDQLGPSVAIKNGALPATPPRLPNGVDCLWMITLSMPPIRAVYWLGDGGWHDIVLTQADVDSSQDNHHAGKMAL